VFEVECLGALYDADSHPSLEFLDFEGEPDVGLGIVGRVEGGIG
jgi:hypothetical protein